MQVYGRIKVVAFWVSKFSIGHSRVGGNPVEGKF